MEEETNTTATKPFSKAWRSLKCTPYNVDSSLAAAQDTVSYVQVVGQEASPGKCVLLSTSKAARRRMLAWRNKNDGCFWTIKLNVRSPGCDFTGSSWCFKLQS